MDSLSIMGRAVFEVSIKVIFKRACSATDTRFDTFQYMNNKCTDQTLSAWMCRLVCTFVVPIPLKVGFLASGPLLM